MVFISFSLITVEVEHIFIIGHLDFKSFTPYYCLLWLSYWFVGVFYIFWIWVLASSDYYCCATNIPKCSGIKHKCFLFLLMLLRIRIWEGFGWVILSWVSHAVAVSYLKAWLGWMAGSWCWLLSGSSAGAVNWRIHLWPFQHGNLREGELAYPQWAFQEDQVEHVFKEVVTARQGDIPGYDIALG